MQNILEVRNFITTYPECLCDNVDGNDIMSTRKYTFRSKRCKHTFDIIPTNLTIIGDDLSCPYCCGHVTKTGVNDINTIAHHLMPYLFNKEDGHKYSPWSNKKIKWKCPDCGFEFMLSPNKMMQRTNLCQNCADYYSYGEKIVRGLLEYLYEPYVQHCIFDWSDRKEYDFWLLTHNSIVEVHGKQHYKKNGFELLGGQCIDQQRLTDFHKKEMALQNGIKHYIEIDCQKSELSYIQHSIMNSDLPLLLNFNCKSIDWKFLECIAMKSRINEACELFNSGITDLSEIASTIHCSYNTVKNYLKHGTIIGICNYNTTNRLAEAHHQNGQRIITSMSKPVIQYNENGDMIAEFPSIQEAQRILHISHIWDVIVGRRKTAGGYYWKYKES